MNLADAIRNAAGGAAPFAAVPVPQTTPQPVWVNEEETLATPTATQNSQDQGQEAPATSHKPEASAKRAANPKQQETTMSQNPQNQEAMHPHGSQVVRLELMLTAEQIAALFKSIVTSQHSVMTLREAASHLRLSSHHLEQLAQEGDVPAFQLDGRWRFSRQALDEWLSVQQQQGHTEAA